jgi:CRISPR system Cascade subunit CasB
MTAAAEKSHPNRSVVGTVVADWWSALQTDRGSRAALRRCGTTTDVQLQPVFHRLVARLSFTADDAPSFDRLAAVAAVLSHVDTDAGDREFASLLADSTSGQPVLSDLRFRRILAVTRPDELLETMRRAVRLTDRRAPVAGFANDLFYWGDRTRKRWAFRYYAEAELD